MSEEKKTWLDRMGLIHLWATIKAMFDNKVDKIPGFSLSENNYSNDDKAKLDAIDTSLYALKSDIVAVYRYKGSVDTIDDLPSTGQTIGDVYDVSNDMNYAWNGTAWDALGGTFTVDSITSAEIDEIISN